MRRVRVIYEVEIKEENYHLLQQMKLLKRQPYGTVIDSALDLVRAEMTKV